MVGKGSVAQNFGGKKPFARVAGSARHNGTSSAENLFPPTVVIITLYSSAASAGVWRLLLVCEKTMSADPSHAFHASYCSSFVIKQKAAAAGAFLVPVCVGTFFVFFRDRRGWLAQIGLVSIYISQSRSVLHFFTPSPFQYSQHVSCSTEPFKSVFN